MGRVKCSKEALNKKQIVGTERRVHPIMKLSHGLTGAPPNLGAAVNGRARDAVPPRACSSSSARRGGGESRWKQTDIGRFTRRV